MRISRLYIPDSLHTGKRLILNEDNAHYVRTVLRLKANDPLTLFNSKGGEYRCTLTEVSRKAVVLEVGAYQSCNLESPLYTVLGLSIARGDRMDFVVQKAVELGVQRICPLLSERCVVQLKGDAKIQRLNHWQKIAHHAAEQSGRTIVPEFSDILSLPDWLECAKGLKIFLDPYASATLGQLATPNLQVSLLTGPEGGFSDSERNKAKQAGFIPVRLGARILRTETASLAALSAVQLLWGDFSS